MRKINAILKSLLILAVALPSSCVDYEEDVPKQDTIPLTFYLQTSGGRQTRGYEGEEEAINHENDINTVEVWLYDGSVFVGYSNTLIDNNKIQINIPQSVVNKGTIDVYVIANGKSVGLENLGAAEPRISLETLQTKLLGGSNFLPTTNGNNRTKEVPSDGLPFSQMLLGVPISSTGVQATLPDITLTRAVSKFRFAFARTIGMNDVAITGIELKEGLIASNEYIFPRQDTETEKNYGEIGNATYYGDRLPNLQDATYVTTSMLWGANTQTGTETSIIPASDINEVGYPERMTFSYLNSEGRTMTGPDYEDYVTENFIKYKDGDNNTLYHDDFLTYLRETDKPLEITFYYRLRADENKIHKTTFTMAAANDFARNHIWTVYAYFKGGGLYVVPQVMPWQWGGELEFFSKTTVQLTIDNTYNLYEDGGEEKHFNYLMYSPDENNDGSPDYNNWDNNYCAVAYGFDGSRPTYSPWLVLRSTSMNMLQLQTDNTEFGFVLVNTVDETFSSILDVIDIPAGKDVSTNFYVVPKEQLNLSNPPSRFVNVMLIERTASFSDTDVPEISVNRLPWNSKLPGAESHETAQFYWVTATDYSQNMNGTTETLQKQ